MSTMSHAGYEATVEYDSDADLIHGEVLHMRDIVTFQGRSIDDLKRALADSIEDYIAFCESTGRKPS